MWNLKDKKLKKIQSITNILVLDDEEALINMWKDNVKHPADTKIYYCTSTLEALNLLKSKKIHGVLSDVNVPMRKELDDELATRYSEIPIYRMSGAVNHCVNLMLEKPCSLEAFQNILAEIAGLARACKAS